MTIETPATVLASLNGVTVDGAPVAAPEAARLFLYHKPVGLLVTERDPRGRPTIYDRLPSDLPRLVPVGRLDLNTEGLLLLTTDGGLKRQLELPASGVERTYRARAYGQVSQAQLEELIDGIEIDGIRYGSIDANLERRTGANVWIELTLTEGKNREVRRVLEHLGLEVSRLIRVRYGPFVLGDLPANGVGEVRPADLEAFRRTLKDRAPARGEQGPIRATPVVKPTDRPARRTGTGPAAGRPRSAADRAGAAARKTDAAPQRGPNPKPAAPSAAPRSRTVLGGMKVGAGPRPGSEEATPVPARPAKLQRKPGWAKPKPKAGPGRPRKPRP